MFLHVGDNEVLDEEKIVMIINNPGKKPSVLLTDGSRREVKAHVLTLRQRARKGAPVKR